MSRERSVRLFGQSSVVYHCTSANSVCEQSCVLLRRPHVFQVLRAIGSIAEAMSRALADSDGDAEEENIFKI